MAKDFRKITATHLPPEVVVQSTRTCWEPVGGGNFASYADGYDAIFEMCDDEPAGLDEFLAEEEKLTRAIRLAVFRKIVGYDPRSMQEIADSLSCTRAAISRVFRLVMNGLGLIESEAKAVHRRHLADARLDVVARNEAEQKAREAWAKHRQCITNNDTAGAEAAKAEFFRQSDKAAGLQTKGRRKPPNGAT